MNRKTWMAHPAAADKRRENLRTVAEALVFVFCIAVIVAMASLA